MGNFVKFESFAVDVKDLIESKALIALEEAAGEIRAAVQRNSRVDTGGTKQNWEHHVLPENLEAIVAHKEENALWEEFGTGEHALEGKGRQTPWYIPVDTYTGKRKPTYKGKVVIVHSKNGTDFYKTDGKKPSRALHKAYESKKKTVKKICEHYLGEIDDGR